MCHGNNWKNYNKQNDNKFSHLAITLVDFIYNRNNLLRCF